MREYDYHPETIARELYQRFGDGALAALKEMVYSPERRGRAERIAIYDETARLLRDMQSTSRPGERIDHSA